MTYQFKRGVGSLEANLRKVAASEIDKALKEIDNPELGPHETVHQVRKRCKKLRGLIRLVRGAFDAYEVENQRFRDAAAELSFVRDAEATIETFDKLIAFHGDQIDLASFATIRARLLQRRTEILDQHDLDDKLFRFREGMSDTRDRVDHWTLQDKGFEAIAGGLAKTYNRARKGMRQAATEPTTENLHEWRKRVKYHWYHARLLRDLRPDVMKVHIAPSEELSELLGDHHDLHVLHETLFATLGAFDDPAELSAFAGLIASRQSDLEREAFALGSKLLAEKGYALVKRWRTSWLSAMCEEDVPEKALAVIEPGAVTGMASKCSPSR